ncbi:MAG TPA: hypothetical protein VJ377_02410 [Dehalococcoidales bacterium]|nr:MAG: hypothetical protein A2Z05_05310 [Chloroflexi bacterium RBG_16_60_22]HJX12360.1 hypothetical protein [Dehalococcoidales bacterium]
MEKKATSKTAATGSADPAEKFVKKQAPGRGTVEILAESYEPGEPEGEEAGRWRQKLGDRNEKIKYLKSGERYWYSDDWFGSEKRKNPA